MIVAISLKEGETGAYTLSVRKLKDEAKPPAKDKKGGMRISLAL